MLKNICCLPLWVKQARRQYDKIMVGPWACVLVALGPPLGFLGGGKKGRSRRVHIFKKVVLHGGRFCKIGTPPRRKIHCRSLGLSLDKGGLFLAKRGLALERCAHVQKSLLFL